MVKSLNLEFSGRIVSGEGIATGLGCPSANIAIEEGVIIHGLGIYVGEAELDGTLHPALVAINDGKTGNTLKLEVHLLDGDPGDIAGKFMRVILHQKLRELTEWESDEHIKSMICKDIENARAWFASKQALC